MKFLTITLALITSSASLLAQAACPQVLDINQSATPDSGNPIGNRHGSGGKVQMSFVKCHKLWFFSGHTPEHGEELWATDGTPSGTRLVKDIRPGQEPSNISDITTCGDKVYFRADDGVTGMELWRSDGTESGTIQLIDLNKGPDSSNPSHLECAGRYLYFAADDGATGVELWRTDTLFFVLTVKDIFEGPESSNPSNLCASPTGDTVYFSADDGTHGRELWKSDGSRYGTQLIGDLYAGSKGSYPAELTTFGATTVFRATHPTKGIELWKTDGTASGTTLVKDIHPTGSSTPFIITGAVLGAHLYFTANDGTNGIELWRTDGTAAGTSLAFDVNPGPASGTPVLLHAHGSSIYFAANGSTSTGRELWVYTQKKARMVKDIFPGPAGSMPTGMQSVGKYVVFRAGGPGGPKPDAEPYVTDGTTSGTTQLRDIYPGALEASDPYWFTAISPTKALFTASDYSANGQGRELWETDGTPTGTKLFRDISPGRVTASSSPAEIHSRGDNTVLMQANDGKSGNELWIADANGVRMLVDINPGPPDSNPKSFVNLPNKGASSAGIITLFMADHAVFGRELWVTDGTNVDLVYDIRYGPPTGMTSALTTCGDKAYFAANNGIHGIELWSSDGTRAGTKMVSDLQPGAASSNPGEPVYFRGKVYFAADIPSHGRELCVYGGDTGSIRLVKDIYPGTPGSNPANLLRHGEHLLFTAQDPNLGTELWISDGTESGTYVLYDTYPGPGSGLPTNLTQADNRLFFVTNDSINGRELWVSDLTTFGTEMVKDINSGSVSSSPRYLTWARGKLFFNATTTNATLATGSELYTSDGTDTGTGIVADLNPGYTSADPRDIVIGGNGVFFSAATAADGRELFYSDGSGLGTHIACDLYPGPTSSNPANLTACNGRIYFSGETYRDGSELHQIGGFPATSETLGEGCGPTSPTLRCSPPVIGQAVSLSGFSGYSSGAHLLVIGVLANPSSIPGLVAPGCNIWTDIGLPILVTPHPPGPRWSLNLPVGSSLNLVGRQLTLQGAYSPVPLSMSNGLQLTIGL